MGAHIEWIRTDVGILRCGSSFIEYGDKYDFACTVDVSQGTAEFKGGISEIMVNFVRERDYIRKCLQDAGVLEVLWTRKREGQPDKIVRYTV